MPHNSRFCSFRPTRALALLACFCAGLTSRSLSAQAPFNTMVLPKSALQLQLQSQGYAAPSASGGWIWALPAAAIGLGRGVELTAGASIVRPRPDISAPTDVTVGAKWRLFSATDLGTEVAVGTFAFFPTSHRSAAGIRPDRYGFAYAALSQALPITWGVQDPSLAPQLTIAGFASVGRDPLVREGLNESRGGFSLGIDQALPAAATRRVGLTGKDDLLALSVSWVSGNSAFGYASAGLNIVSGRHTWSLGYARGNQAARNHGPSLAYALTF